MRNVLISKITADIQVTEKGSQIFDYTTWIYFYWNSNFYHNANEKQG